MSLLTLSRVLVLAFLQLPLLPTIEATHFRLKDAPQSNASAPVAKARCVMEVLTNLEGVDFFKYMEEVFRAIRKSWLADMPPSLEKGIQGVNQVEFHLLQDGSIAKDSLKMISPAGKSDFDAASLQAVRDTPQLGHLPKAFSKPLIVLRFTFYYNVPPPGEK
jgi:TonB family protein